MSVIASWTILFALAAIAIIGVELLIRSPGRRVERAQRGDVAPGVDPVNLRRRRPLTQRLSGAVLIVAALVILLVIRPLLGL